MKKVFVILLSLLLIAQFAVFAGADAQYSTAGDLYQAWMAAQPDWRQNPYPEYVCGVWSTDGGINNLTIAVTKDEAGEAGKAEILDLLENDESVAFTYQSYSYAELLAARLEIETQLGKDNGMHSIGIYEMQNHIGVGIDETHPKAEGFMQKLLKEYGNMVCIELSTGPINTLEDIAYVDIGGTVEQGPSHLWILLLAGTMVLCTGGFFLLRQRRLAVQTANGEVQTASSLSRKQTAQLVRQSTAEPHPEALKELLKKLP